jgi:uncharacterized protein YlaN (UPF0358 family)
MKRIENYLEFINEEFFKRLEKSKKSEDRIQKTVKEILKFLNDNQINDWDDFLDTKPFDRDVINKLIDHGAKDWSDVKEIKFEIRLELSNITQLKEYLKELEYNEEYEKCARIIKKISNN